MALRAAVRGGVITSYSIHYTKLYEPGFEGEVFRFTMDNFMFAAMDDAVSDTVLIDLIDGNSFVSPGILGPFEIGSDTCAITVTRIP